MKAIYFERHGDRGVLQYGDAPDPVLAPGHVILRVRASACNPGDVWSRQGFPGMAIPLPHIPGSDAAGDVVAVAPGVEHLRPGDAVIVHPGLSCRQCKACLRGEEFFCRAFKILGQRTGPWIGAHAEYLAVPAINCVAKPESLTYEETAALPVVLVTVWRQLVVRASLRAGQFVLVWGGAGGLGSVAIQLCRAFGAAAIAVASDDEKLEVARRLGAAHVIHRKRNDVVEAVKDLTNGEGADIVFEHVGQQTWPTSILAAKRGGIIVTSGATSGPKAETDLRYVFTRHLTLAGTNLGSVGDLHDALRVVRDGQVKPVIHSRLPLERHAEAQQMLEEGEVIGKIVHTRSGAEESKRSIRVAS